MYVYVCILRLYMHAVYAYTNAGLYAYMYMYIYMCASVHRQKTAPSEGTRAKNDARGYTGNAAICAQESYQIFSHGWWGVSIGGT
jgi:hypothetical protein